MRGLLLAGIGLLLLTMLVPLSHADPAEEAVRRIVYWEKWGGFEGDAIQAVVDRFNRLEREKAAATPDYRPIEVELVQVSQLDQKLLVAIAGGNPPDLAGAWTWLVYSYSEKGALMDLTPFVAESELGPSHYLPVFWDMCQYQGRTWALPTTPASTALHWNKRLFREAGLDPDQPPRDLAELERMAEACTVWEVATADGTEQVRGWASDVPADKKRLVQVGFLPNEPNWWPWAWSYYFGGRLWDGQHTASADGDGNLAAMRWINDYVQRIGSEHVKKFTSGFGGFASPQNPFMDGRIAMEVQGVWMYNFIDKYSPGMSWGAAPFPPPAGRPDLALTNNVEADVVVIPKASRHPEEAWTFIEFLSSQSGMEQLCMGHRKFSPLTTVSEEFRRQHPHPAIDLFRELAIAEQGFSTPKMGMWNEYKRELGVAFDRIMALDPEAEASKEHPVTVESIMAEVQERAQAALDRNRRMREIRSR